MRSRGEKNASANPLNIKGLSRIPDNVGLLIVNSPAEDYSASEISVLLEFAERGGRIIFLINEANQKMSNLNDLFKCYGLFVQDGTLSSGESDKIEATSNTSDGTAVSLVGASEIKTVNVGNVTVETLLSVDVEEPVETEQTENGEAQAGDSESSESTTKTVTKTVAAVAYENQKPTIALITGADTFNISTSSSMSDEEKREYLVAMSFLQSITTGRKKGFESSLSFGEPIAYATEVLTLEKSSAIIFGVLLVGVVPLALLLVPTVNIFARKNRSRAQ